MVDTKCPMTVPAPPSPVVSLKLDHVVISIHRLKLVLICVQLDLHLNPLIAPFLPLCFQFQKKHRRSMDPP